MNSELPPHQQGETVSVDSGWDRPLGLLLREARQARGLSTSDVGQRLHLTVVIIDAIERDDFDRLGASVYARGYLNSYARLVGVPTAHVDRALASYPRAAPPLESTSHTPRWQYLYDRYAKRAMYIALTGVIVFPIVLLGLRERLPINPPRLLSLDSYGEDQSATKGETDDANAPVTASLAPFYRDTQPLATAPTPDPRDAGPALASDAASTTLAHSASTAEMPPAAAEQNGDGNTGAVSAARLRLVFNGTSWVEVLSRDGHRLAYGLIAAGQVRSFDAADVGRVAIGDADAVSVSLDGRALNLTDFRHAKVVRFALSSAGEAVDPGG